MNEPFDAYHQWLGIPPAEQPANYYRLLGVQAFEHDPDVIAAAADQRMEFVRSFQLSARAGESQQLLNELATAKVCLLNERSKARYDTSLRKAPEIAVPATTDPQAAGPPPIGAPPIQQPPVPPPVQLTTVTQAGRPTAGRRRPKIRPEIFMVISSLVLVALCCIVVMQRRQAQRQPQLGGPPPIDLPAAGGNEKLAGKTVIVDGDVVSQNEHGGVILPAKNARVAGEAVPLQNGAIVISSPAAKPLQWDLLIRDPGIFMIEVTYSANRAAVGGAADITINDRTVAFYVRDIGDEQEFVTDETAMAAIRRGGRYTLNMTFTTMPPGAKAQIKSVRLRKAATRTSR